MIVKMSNITIASIATIVYIIVSNTCCSEDGHENTKDVSATRVSPDNTVQYRNYEMVTGAGAVQQ